MINHIKPLLNKPMMEFIISFISADIAIMLMQSLVIWVLYERLGIEYVSGITLFALFLNTFVSKKIGVLLDKYSRLNAVIFANALMIGVMIVAISTQWLLFYALFSVLSSVYFSIFYGARSAVAQAMSIQSHNQQFKRLNSMLMVTDRMGAILVGAMIAALFAPLGINTLAILAVLILLLSVVLLTKFKRYRLDLNKAKTQKSTTSNLKRLWSVFCPKNRFVGVVCRYRYRTDYGQKHH